jgi:hypothetical protein
MRETTLYLHRDYCRLTHASWRSGSRSSAGPRKSWNRFSRQPQYAVVDAGLAVCSSYIDIAAPWPWWAEFYMGLKSVWVTHLFWGWFIICFYMASRPSGFVGRA